jgi:hypothetical protein
VDTTTRTGRVRLTRLVPDSVTISGPRRAVRAVSSVRTVDQTLTVRDSGEFVVPLDVGRLGSDVRVKPSEVRVLVQMPPVTRARRDSARVTALRPK